MASQEVVVWEFMNSFFASWCTFEPHQCNIIEKAYQSYFNPQTSKQQNSHTVVSGHNHEVNFMTMDETHQQTGDTYPVRRLEFPLDSAIGNNVQWQWNISKGNNSLWHPYSADVVDYIEDMFQKKQPSIDLSKKFSDLEYTIDFSSKMQINNHTKYQRPVQRIELLEKYPRSRKLRPRKKRKGASSSSSAAASSSNDHGDGSSSLPPVPQGLALFAEACSNPPNDSCSICLVPLNENSGFSEFSQGSSKHATVVFLKKCKHIFHSDCLLASLKNNLTKCSLTCPTCKTIYGVKKGTQPPGSMTHSVIPMSLPGHSGCGTIVITYNFRNGTQTKEHPNPGKRYYAHSFPRKAYLPDSSEGRKILALLKIAFDRRLIFTVGRSVTLGIENTITWNEIHHKTEMGSNHSGHGFPDPNYFHNVVEELKQQGVTEDDLKQ